MSEYTTNHPDSHLRQALILRAQGSCHNSLNRSLHLHEGLIHAVIRREGTSSLTYQEALRAGRIGLWRAIPSTSLRTCLGCDLTRGTAFSTYAWVAIRRHILNSLPACG